MKRFCAIGNSHLAALKLGWDRVPEVERPAAFDFFASRSQTLVHTFVDGGTLKSDDEAVRRTLEMTGGAPEIDLGAYDGFLVIGCGLHFRWLALMTESATIHPSLSPGLRLLSRETFVEGYLAQIRKTAAWHLAERLSGARDAPVYVIPEPFFDRLALASGEQPHVERIHDRGLGGPFAEMFDAACGRAFAEWGRFLPQLPETREDFVFTAARYGEDSVGIRKMIDASRTVRRPDYVHKNADYGETTMLSFCALAA